MTWCQVLICARAIYSPQDRSTTTYDFTYLGVTSALSKEVLPSPTYSTPKVSKKLDSGHYTGKRLDSGSGTYDIGARRYSASTGRLLQYDVFYDALDNLGLAEDPLTQNRYTLTGGNPVNFVEVDGHRPGLAAFRNRAASQRNTPSTSSRFREYVSRRAAMPRAAICGNASWWITSRADNLRLQGTPMVPIPDGGGGKRVKEPFGKCFKECVLGLCPRLATPCVFLLTIPGVGLNAFALCVAAVCGIVAIACASECDS